MSPTLTNRADVTAYWAARARDERFRRKADKAARRQAAGVRDATAVRAKSLDVPGPPLPHRLPQRHAGCRLGGRAAAPGLRLSGRLGISMHGMSAAQAPPGPLGPQGRRPADALRAGAPGGRLPPASMERPSARLVASVAAADPLVASRPARRPARGARRAPRRASPAAGWPPSDRRGRPARRARVGAPRARATGGGRGTSHPRRRARCGSPEGVPSRPWRLSSTDARPPCRHGARRAASAASYELAGAPSLRRADQSQRTFQWAALTGP